MATAKTVTRKQHEGETHFEVVTVTPDLAQEWLEKNTDNRKVAQTQVEAFARVMKKGGWKVNNQAIGFGTDGRLVDGQHRLWAIIEANVSVRISVAYNVADDAVKTIDRGRVRSVGEVLRREGDMPDPQRVTAWCNSERFLVTNNPGRGGVEDTEAYFAANRRGVEFMLAALPSKPPFKPSVIGASLILAHRRHAAVVEEFVPSMVMGTGLNETSPIYVARELIIAATGNYNMQRRVLGLKLLRCLQAFTKHETLKRSHVLATESTLHLFVNGK